MKNCDACKGEAMINYTKLNELVEKYGEPEEIILHYKDYDKILAWLFMSAVFIPSGCIMYCRTKLTCGPRPPFVPKVIDLSKMELFDSQEE